MNVCVVHRLLPGHEMARADARSGETVATFLRRTQWARRDRRHGWQFRLPTILVVNGRPVLRKAWRRTRIAPNDQVEFLSRPGDVFNSASGRSILGLAAVIGLSLLAPGIGAAIGGSLFGLALGGAGTTIASLIGAGVVLGGTLLVNTLIASKPATQTDAPVDQIYSASASGNVVRLMQPIKLSYGTIKTFPDLAAQPWSEFGAPPVAAGNSKALDANQDKTGNDQYLNVLLLVGLGKYTDISIFDDDTPFWTRPKG